QANQWPSRKELDPVEKLFGKFLADVVRNNSWHAKCRLMAKKSINFRQTFGRTDFVEALGNLVTGKLFLSSKPVIDIRQIECFIFRPSTNRFRAQDAQTVVDILHLWHSFFLVIRQNALAIEPDIARAPAALVFE